MLKQREIIRDFRREAMLALQANDVQRYNDVRAEYAKQFPELPPLRLKKSDMRALQLRQTTTRLERVLKTLPTDVRPFFQSIAREALMTEVSAISTGGLEGLQVVLPTLNLGFLNPNPNQPPVGPPF